MLQCFLTPLIGLHLHTEACFICGTKEMAQFCDELSSKKRYRYERKSLIILYQNHLTII